MLDELGGVTRVTVTLHSLSHTYPSDLDALLVGPRGQAVMLMSDAGGSFGVTSLSWTIQGRGDFNGDGKTDILWRETASGTLYEWQMDGATVIGAGYTAAQADNTWVIQAR